MRKHVVFVVDASRSMDKCDVIDQGVYKRRIEAVLDACFDFIKDQLQDGRSSAEDRYSVVSFNDVAKVQLRGKRMGRRNLYGLRKDLEAKIRPTHGTSYGAGLASAWDVASGGIDDAGEQFVLIFLSDGRPRDMNASCKREQAPASWLRTMRERFRRRLTFHGVGVGPEDFQLLEELCTVAQGTFHQASLASVMRGGTNAAKAPALRGRPETLSNTFSEISSSVSSLCSSSRTRTKKCLVLEDVEEGEWNSTDVDQHHCDKLELEGGRLVVQMRDLEVLVREKPFAEGGMRHCFRMWELGLSGQRPKKGRGSLVGKQSKFYLSVSDQLTAFKHDLHCHTLARQQAEQFNHELESFRVSKAANDLTYAPLRNSRKGLKVTSCNVYRLEDDQEPGGFRYLLVEPFLEGKYIKYNGNNGYVGKQAGLDKDQLCWWHVAQAFSHFTHHRSGGRFLVCDMQGVDRHVTDPAVHSRLRTYGDGDRGSKGIRDFLDTHQCNAICQHLHLPRPGVSGLSVVPPTHTVAAPSSAVKPYALGCMGFALLAHEVIYEEDEEYYSDLDEIGIAF